MQPRESTGIHRLDEVIGGGLPRPSITALVGAPGSGTTSFCKGFIASSLTRGGTVILVCGDEPPNHFMRHFDAIESFDVQSYLEQGKLFVIDLYENFTQLLGIRDYTDLGQLENASLYTIVAQAREYITNKANRQPKNFNIVVDSLTAFSPFIGMRDSSRGILEGRNLARKGNHVIIVTAHEGVLEGNFVQEVRKQAHNVIRMRMRSIRSNLKREMIIEKMSFMEIKQPILEYVITDVGVEGI